MSGKEYEPGSVLVHFKKNVGEKRAKKIARAFGLKPLSWFSWSHTLAVKVPNGEEEKWVEKFMEIDVVEDARLNMIRRVPRW